MLMAHDNFITSIDMKIERWWLQGEWIITAKSVVHVGGETILKHILWIDLRLGSFMNVYTEEGLDRDYGDLLHICHSFIFTSLLYTYTYILRNIQTSNYLFSYC